MRLGLPEIDRARRARFESDIARLADCERLRGPVCRPDCPEAKSRPCTAACPSAPVALTSDGALPIEDGIVPLVFELKASRAFEPIWSCEGHLDPSGDLFRAPSVWFCCECISHVRVLADVLAQLKFDRTISCPWRVSLCCPGHDTPNTVFSLEPDAAANATLEQLQSDARMIASGLRRRLAERASRF